MPTHVLSAMWLGHADTGAQGLVQGFPWTSKEEVAFYGDQWGWSQPTCRELQSQGAVSRCHWSAAGLGLRTQPPVIFKNRQGGQGAQLP